MIIKNFKLFAICVLCLHVYVQARSISVYNMGDVYIARSEDKWACDRIECPLDAFRCFVSKSNEENPSILKRVNTCYTKDNQVLVTEEFEAPADPTSRIREQVTFTRNGDAISASSGLENYDDEKFKAEMKEKMDKMQAEMDAKMKELHDKLQQMNENINKKIHNQMKNLDHNLSQMEYNLAHMFD
ncbi:uncharacterized protein LOC119606188 [Lucilia sericata]|uniref:uncharacterized protein LOC119606188 n=1 Tax=Lucilia sericata TaxID=13632 RepID=UPI0018A7F110|nr:uncharacterized protein LOC119606188 [Lucilia sericata]